MAARSYPKPLYDASRVALDMARRGWGIMDLASRADVSHMTIRRFLDGSAQTTKTAARIAMALGFSPRRYLRGVSTTEAA